MTDLPDGWDHYDPDDHARTSDPEYRRARDAAARRPSQSLACVAGPIEFLNGALRQPPMRIPPM